MRRFPNARATLHRLRTRGIGWGTQRIREELRTPTYRVSEHAGWYVERTRRLVRRSRSGSSAGQHGADVTAVYPLTAGSVGFDFAYFLIFAEAYARSLGLRSIFVILLHTRENPTPEAMAQAGFDDANLTWRINNIVVPMIEMHPASIGYAVLSEHANVDDYLVNSEIYPPRFSSSYRPRITYSRSLPDLRADQFDGFSAPVQARRYIQSWQQSSGIDGPMVVITLRQREYDATRNSNVAEWAAFATWLEGEGYVPVFVPDTEATWRSEEALAGFRVFREAPWNLAMRLALYEHAFVNLFFSNGPAALAALDKSTRYIAFNPPNEQSLHATTDALERIATPVDKTRYRFAGPGQVLSSEIDSRDRLQREFSAFVSEVGS